MTENAPAPTQVEEGRRRHRRDDMPWLGGLILIVLGVIFLAGNFTGFQLTNWWALFILIPALGSLGTAWRLYQTHGRWTAASRGPLFGGLILLAVAAMFLFNLNWGRLWPVLLILAGLGALSNALVRD